MKKEEPTELDNDLEERLLSARNHIDLALLALENNRMDLVPTAIEGGFYLMQHLLDDYCVNGRSPTIENRAS